MRLTLSILLLIVVPHLMAHEVPTHANITRAAVNYLSQIDNRALCSSKINDLLQIGTAAEDDRKRPIFHFTPALSIASASCSSIQWGFGAGSCQYSIPIFGTTVANNQHKWSDAISHAKDSAGNPSEEGLRDLGYVLHLLEDLTSPAHTRNDPHLNYEGHGDADPVESEIRIPTAPPVSDGFVSAGSAEALFSELQQFTSRNFYSKDTVFQGDGPIATRSDTNYFYDNRSRRIAYKGLRYTLSGLTDATRNQQYATIDDTIATDQFRELGPIAVRYAASLIKIYIDLTSPKLDGCFVDFEKFNGGSVFSGVQPPLKVEGATISGGQILSGTTNLPRNQTTVYGTAYFCPGCSPTLTIDFENSVDGVSMLLMNGQTFTVQYTVIDNVGGSKTLSLVSNSQSGAAVVELPSKQIKQVKVNSNTSSWDFFIDNIFIGKVSTTP
ncbi:hypothetical protein ACHMW6_28900 [Pseudoduganella sp. UC29_106]|uniref:hypothetical protein n=1 Tax=Pseudoduganella sp. UC29_106 TaxID=3374553 RepID=UPI0037565A85